MKKFGRLNGIEYQLCYALGLHLTVCDLALTTIKPRLIKSEGAFPRRDYLWERFVHD